MSGEKAIADRIEKSWKILLSICHGREKKKTEDVWAQKLDKLFDITKCKCLIVLCADPESHCDSTSCDSNGAHINCSCERQLKLPKYDLVWVKDQREKVGTKSSHQFGKVNKVESDRIEGMRLRREQDQQRLVRQQEKEKEREEQELRGIERKGPKTCQRQKIKNVIKQLLKSLNNTPLQHPSVRETIWTYLTLLQLQ